MIADYVYVHCQTRCTGSVWLSFLRPLWFACASSPNVGKCIFFYVLFRFSLVLLVFLKGVQLKKKNSAGKSYILNLNQSSSLLRIRYRSHFTLKTRKIMQLLPINPSEIERLTKKKRLSLVSPLGKHFYRLRSESFAK